MTPDDLAALHALCFDRTPRPWSAQAFRDMLAAPGVRLIAADDGAGFILLRTVADEAEVLTLCCHPARRRAGIARGLLDRAERAAAAGGARVILLEVAQSNAAARGLYAAAGYAPAGHRKDYYDLRGGGAVSALVLRKPLN